MNWNFHPIPSFQSTNSDFNRVVGLTTSYAAGNSIPFTKNFLKHGAGLGLAATNEFMLSNETIGKFVTESTVNTAISAGTHIGGGPGKTIHHDDGTKTIIHYNGVGVDAESTIIKVDKDGKWNYV